MTREEKRVKLVDEMEKIQDEINEKRRKVAEIKRQLNAMSEEERRERLAKLDKVIRDNNRTIEDVIDEVQRDGERLPEGIEAPEPAPEPDAQNPEYQGNQA